MRRACPNERFESISELPRPSIPATRQSLLTHVNGRAFTEVSLIHPSWYERQAAFLPSDKGVEVRGTVDAIRAQGMEMGVESLLCLRAFSDDGEEGFVALSMRPMIAGA